MGLDLSLQRPFIEAEATRKQPEKVLLDRPAGGGTHQSGWVTHRLGPLPSRTFALSFLVATALPYCPATAAGSNMMGIGVMSCAEVLPLIDDRLNRSALVAWAGGFMSGANAALTVRDHRFRDLSKINIELVIGSVKAYCAEHTDNTVAHAVEAFWGDRPMRPVSP